MAYVGLLYPYIAKYTENGYTDGFKCGSAIATNVTPTYAEGSLQGDNQTVIYKKKFTDADVSLTVTELPSVAAEVMFGHTVTNDEVIYKSTDDSNYVGFGYVSDYETDSGAAGYEATVMPQVKFTEDAVQYQTRGDSITFTSPSVSGKARADANGEWKYVKKFDTLVEADAYIKDKLDFPDASLSSLTIGSLVLSPTFAKGKLAYTTTTTNDSDTITATATDTDNATVVIKNGSTTVESGNAATWVTGANYVTITVTNGTESRVYSVTVTKTAASAGTG